MSEKPLAAWAAPASSRLGGTAALFSLALVLTSSVCLPPAALAVHEVDHRYNVVGFVLDENQRPLAGSAVTVRLDGATIGRQTTNAQGYYNVQLHLHDSDLGRTLELRTAAGEGTIRVSFTPGDSTTPRIHHANFIAGKLIEEPLSRRRHSAWVYIVPVTAVLLLYAAYKIEKRWRRARKRALAAPRPSRKRRR